MSAARAIPDATIAISVRYSMVVALFEIYFTQQTPQRIPAARTFLSARDHPIAVQQHVERIALGFEECSEIGVFRQYDFGRARRLFQILLDCLLRFVDADREHYQSSICKLASDLVHHGLIAAAILAPRSPELEKNDLALQRRV